MFSSVLDLISLLINMIKKINKTHYEIAQTDVKCDGNLPDFFKTKRFVSIILSSLGFKRFVI